MPGEFLKRIREVSYRDEKKEKILDSLRAHIGNVAGKGKTETSIGWDYSSFLEHELDSENDLNICREYLRDEGFYIREDMYNKNLSISW